MGQFELEDIFKLIDDAPPKPDPMLEKGDLDGYVAADTAGGGGTTGDGA